MSLRAKSVWVPKRGVSINSLAVRRLREVRELSGESRVNALRKLYEDVSRLVSELPDVEAQAVLLSAASDYTMDALLEKAARPFTQTTRREKKIAAYVADLVARGMSEAEALEVANMHFPARRRPRRRA